MNTDSVPARPWYRERWPWILMAGPAIVVVAGLVTAWLAIRSDDGLVIDDYYKQGLSINQTLGRSNAAGRLGIGAELRLADGVVRVLLAGPPGPGALTLRLVHPTRSGTDQSVTLTAVGPGAYAAPVRPPQAGRWHVVLEARNWRLGGDWTLPSAGALTLGVLSLPAGAIESKEGKR